MSATLLAMEKEVLEEGREWTRARLQERLQQAADAIPPVCARSGLLLKREQKTGFTLMTVSGIVSIGAIRGHSRAIRGPREAGTVRCASSGGWANGPV